MAVNAQDMNYLYYGEEMPTAKELLLKVGDPVEMALTGDVMEELFGKPLSDVPIGGYSFYLQAKVVDVDKNWNSVTIEYTSGLLKGKKDIITNPAFSFYKAGTFYKEK